MEKVVAGDIEALGVIFERYRVPLFGFLYRLTNNVSQAEEILPDVFLRVYDKRHTYKPGTKFSSWLYAVARNLTIDRQRRARHYDLLQDQMMADDTLLIDDSMQDNMNKQEISILVKSAINALPDDLKTIIILREYQGLSYREIASVVNMSEQVVRVRAHRARGTLKKLLKPLLETEESIL